MANQAWPMQVTWHVLKTHVYMFLSCPYQAEEHLPPRSLVLAVFVVDCRCLDDLNHNLLMEAPDLANQLGPSSHISTIFRMPQTL